MDSDVPFLIGDAILLWHAADSSRKSAGDTIVMESQRYNNHQTPQRELLVHRRKRANPVFESCGFLYAGFSPPAS